MKKKIIITLALVFVCLIFADSHAGLFKDTVSTGKEIKDPYLEQLFAPEFPYESVRMVETKEGKRYVVVKAKDKITKEVQINYEKKTLFNKGIRIFRSGSVHSERLLISEMKLYRIVTDKPFVIEYCEVENEKIDPYPASEAEDVIRRSGKYIIVRINKDFGKVFKRIEVYPEKESKCPEPFGVGKYPNSMALGCYKDTVVMSEYPQKQEKSRIIFTYISKDEPEKICKFYSERLRKYFEEKGVPLLGDELKCEKDLLGKVGTTIEPRGIDIIGKILSKIKEKTVPLPSGSVVFRVSIVKGVDTETLIRGYSLIQLRYEIEPSAIQEIIDDQKWRIKRYKQRESLKDGGQK